MTPLPQRRRKEGSLLPSFPAPQTIKVPKAVSESFVVFEIYLKVIQRNLVAFVLMMPAFPLVFLIFARSLTPDGTEISSRLVTGSIVFGLGITTVNNLSQAILNDRFTFRLKLLVASPIHPLSYAAGVVAFNSLYGLAMAAAILLFAPLFGIGIQLSLWLIPLMLFTVVSLTGIALIIAIWSPSAQLGNMLANTVGIMVHPRSCSRRFTTKSTAYLAGSRARRTSRPIPMPATPSMACSLAVASSTAKWASSRQFQPPR